MGGAVAMQGAGAALAGPQALDGGHHGPPNPPGPAASPRDRAAAMDTAWYGATGDMAAPHVASPPLPPAAAPPALDSPLVARYRAAGDDDATDRAAATTSGRKQPSKAALAAWIAGGAVVIAAVIVALVLYVGAGGNAMAPAPDDAAAMLPTRMTGLSVELDRRPHALDDVPYRRDGAGIVVTDPKRTGGGYAAAVVLEPAGTRDADFATSFETGLQSGGKVGEFSDTAFDAVKLRTAEVSGTPDVTRVWWYQPYRDAVVVVYASDEATGRRIVEAVVSHNAT